MSKPSAKVIAHSKYGETEVVTLEVELHRFILSENNTHKAQSRNIQSSRAIPVIRQLEQIINDPAMPVFYGKNVSGMVASEELPEYIIEECKEIILWMRDQCVEGVRKLHDLGLHKGLSNRYVEPWMWTKGVVTATVAAWKDMFKLRCHYQAQPEIRVLFEAIENAISQSVPNVLEEGDIHLPYFGDSGVWKKTYEEFCPITKEEAIQISLSCIAQVSYRRLDTTLEKAEKVVGMLNLPCKGVFPEDPPHFSPAEHIAIAVDKKRFEAGKELSGNFHSEDFVQYRKLLEAGVEDIWC